MSWSEGIGDWPGASALEMCILRDKTHICFEVRILSLPRLWIQHGSFRLRTVWVSFYKWFPQPQTLMGLALGRPQGTSYFKKLPNFSFAAGANSSIQVVFKHHCFLKRLHSLILFLLLIFCQGPMVIFAKVAYLYLRFSVQKFQTQVNLNVLWFFSCLYLECCLLGLP